MARETDPRRVFDLHCDTVTKCMEENCGLSGNRLHVSLERYPPDWKLIQCTAIFVRDELRGGGARDFYNAALAVFREQLREHAALAGQIRSPADLDAVLAEKQFGFLLTVEGGHALGGELDAVDALYDDGVRMMTLTWNGANEICGGAGTDEGFSDFGRQVVARMEQRGMIVDVSHLNDKSFWQLSGFAERPFVASHSNARAVCGHRRNLTDEQFREIVRRGGLVGLNFYDQFLADDWERAGVEDLLLHVLHFLELGGEDVLALGSDYDGAEIPDDLAGFEKAPALPAAFARAGISQAVTEKILYGNAHRFFSKHMGGDVRWTTRAPETTQRG